MPILHAIVLGLTQGLTEFLPISSSGHLVLVPWLFGWDDFGGDDKLHKTFDVALHLGTLVGVIAYFRHDVVALARAGLGRRVEPGARRLPWLLALSTVPAALVGALAGDTIEQDLSEVWLIGVLLVVFGVVLGVADRFGGERSDAGFGLADALALGIGQACALVPGVSRSGVTMTVGRARRFSRSAATRLSFLMSLPVIAGALVFKGYEALRDGIPDELVLPMAVGVASSAVAGWFAVWGTLRFVRTRSYGPFVAYRVAAGAAVLVIVATSWR